MSEQQWHIRIPAALLARTDRTAGQKIILSYLWFRQGENGESRRSKFTIADDLGMSVSTVRRAMAELVDLGDIAIAGGGGRTHCNRYAVNPDRAAWFGAEKGVNLTPFSDEKGVNLIPFRAVKGVNLNDKGCQSDPQKGTGKGSSKKGARAATTRPRGKKSFTPPTATEVADYADSLGHTIFDGERFVRYYEDLQWHHKRGGPVKDWRQTVRSWIRRDNDDRAKKGMPPLDGFSQFGTHKATQAEIEALQAEGLL